MKHSTVAGSDHARWCRVRVRLQLCTIRVTWKTHGKTVRSDLGTLLYYLVNR